MANYSATDKLLHKFYLGNYAIAKAGLEMEFIIKGKEADKIEVAEQVFVTGLARSGTTAVMRTIFESGEYASLQYSNMPFILNPNLWKKRSKIEMHERAHNDGIRIDGNSPEEFDEFFWKSQLKDTYIKTDVLEEHQINNETLKLYYKYIQLICLSKGKRKYISKNNNNVLRLNALRRIPNSKIIFLFRNPVSHASSLLKLHLLFSKEHKEDSFSLDYFDYLGHHEFGLHHKPFSLTPYLDRARKDFNSQDINYWMLVWLNYYSYILTQMMEGDILIRFEDLMEEPDRVYKSLSKHLIGQPEFRISRSFTPTTKLVENVSIEIEQECNQVYTNLMKLKI